MKSGKAILAGICGAIVMSVLMLLARLSGMPVNLELLVGSMLTQLTGPTTWIIGFVVHVIAGAVFGLLYAALFERQGRAGAANGAAYGLVHTVLSGLLLGLVPALHPLVPELLAAPGAFMVGLGWIGVVAFALLHVVYGAIVGAMYAPVLHPTHAVAVR